MMKRLFSALIVCTLILSMAGCQKAAPAPAPAAPAPAASAAPSAPAPESAKPKTAYPTRPVEIIMGAAAGGGTDLQIRAIAPFFSKYFGQELVPVAVPGGSGTIAMTQIANSPADGYTLGVPYTGGISIMPGYGDTTYTADSFKYICQYSESPIVLTVNAKGDIKSLDDLIAKGKSGTVLYSCAPAGAIDLAIQAFAMKSGIKMVNVPTEGAAPAIANLLGNQVAAVGVHPINLAGYIESGDVLPLMTFELERTKDMPDVPTAKEKGVDVAVNVWNGLMVPKDTPDEIVDALRKGFEEILADPECVKALNALKATVNYLPYDKLESKVVGESAMFKELIANNAALKKK